MLNFFRPTTKLLFFGLFLLQFSTLCFKIHQNFNYTLKVTAARESNEGLTESWQRKPTNCGLTLLMWWINFMAGKHNANPLEILVYLLLLCAQRGKVLGYSWWVESSKQLKAYSWLHNAHQHKVFLRLPTFGHYLKGRVWGSPILGFRAVLWGRNLHQLKAHLRFPNTS